MTDVRPACPECGRTDLEFSRTVCKVCYLRHWRAGTHHSLPVTPTGPGSITRTEKYCPACKTVKSIDEFCIARDRADGRQGHCKACRTKHRRSRADHYRDYELRKRYQITALEFDLMLAAQAGGCAICDVALNPDGGALSVDHCHTTGRVRGILCGPCNKAIGLFRDDTRLLEKAVRYLKAR